MAVCDMQATGRRNAVPVCGYVCPASDRRSNADISPVSGQQGGAVTGLQ